MKIIRAEEMGMCTGVKKALVTAHRIKRPEEVTILGELVHNEHVNAGLKHRGFKQADEKDLNYGGWTGRVLITAHGASLKRKNEIETSGRVIIDGTCPLVNRLHAEALKLQAAGMFVVIIGDKGHVEIKGVTEDLDDFAVVKDAEEVKAYGRHSIGVVCQTTSNRDTVMRTLKAVGEKNPWSTVEFSDTICPSTLKRQEALKKMCGKADFVFVIGGKNSNNTVRLLEIAEQMKVPAKLVAGPEEVNPRWFIDAEVVGITAGASTPEEVIRAVEDKVFEAGRRFKYLRQEMEHRIHECLCGTEKKY